MPERTPEGTVVVVGPAAGPAPGDGRYRWLVVLALASITTVSYGTMFYAFSVLLGDAGATAELGRAPPSAALALGVVVSGVLAPLVGTACDLLGSRRVFLVGAVRGGAGLAAFSRAAEGWQVLAAWGLLVGPAMACTFYEPAYVTVGQWFPGTGNGKALGVLTLLAGLSATIFVPLTQRLVLGPGWRDATLVLAAVLLAGVATPALVAHAGGRRREERCPAAPRGTGSRGRPPQRAAPRAGRPGPRRVDGGASPRAGGVLRPVLVTEPAQPPELGLDAEQAIGRVFVLRRLADGGEERQVRAVRRRGRVLQVCEHPAGFEEGEDLAVERALAPVLQVVDGERGDDGVEAPELRSPGPSPAQRCPPIGSAMGGCWRNGRRSVEVPLGVRAVEVAQAGDGEHLRGHEARVDAHPLGPATGGGPVRDAAANPAAVEPDGPVVPHVDVGGRVGGQQAHLVRRVVGPQDAIAAAYRAVALRDLRRRGVDLQANRTAMARSLHHRSHVAPFWYAKWRRFWIPVLPDLRRRTNLGRV
ncbi:MAG: hypothetical protein AVDCRST_MAG12-1328 [uncultured Rubrobacteraceae bacterium]|uniref:Major facilitator superfamily (MFS) profile domain-containing protein n=1 Tax=uncultured Rubrobacteraceae bacterium TaxID=349277 RepID=A0A6J4RPX7_9ACTN|nr:MAG: hypothetical protein AVDCRST_MAG12-1328 [uncultured Rubrobacteraceae bacterium]